MIPIATRLFTLSDQILFAELSGDTNPIHVDPIAARRLLFGEPIVHGMHAFLWMLNRIIEDNGIDEHELIGTTLKARFRRPIFLDEPVQLVRSEGLKRKKFSLITGGAELMSLAIGPAQAWPSLPDGDIKHYELDRIQKPLTQVVENPDGARGKLFPKRSGAEELKGLFPALAAALSAERLVAIAALSSLAGMVIPGEDSLITSTEVTLLHQDSPVPRSDAIDFGVVYHSTELKTLKLQTSSHGLLSTVDCLIRPRPVEQISYAAAALTVPTAAFSARKALIVGGTRGLGNLAAKILAAGGAEVHLTYNSGEAEATALARELNATASHLDVRNPSPDDLSRCRHDFDTLIYCATPKITFRRLSAFDEMKYQSFLKIYVEGFERVFEEFRAGAPERKLCIYPSSIFVEQDSPDTIEYKQAKLAGEDLCRRLAARYPGVTFRVPRLDRFDTDQTAMLQASQAGFDASEIFGTISRLCAFESLSGPN